MPSAVGGPGALLGSPIAPGTFCARNPGKILGSFVGSLPAETAAGGTGSYKIAGITRDANANPLGNCTVIVFYTGTDGVYTKVVSDGAGKWSALVPDKTTLFYAVSFNAAGTQAGATVNNLVGS